MAQRNDAFALQIVPHAPANAPRDQKKSTKDKIPRPPNAWILYRADISRTLLSEGRATNMSQSAISKVISQMWNALDAHSRQGYERLAEVRKMEHALKYPNYRYAPKSKEQKEREKEKKRLDKAIHASARATQRHRGPGSPPTDTIPYPVVASTRVQSVSSSSTDGPTPPLSIDDTPSPVTPQDEAVEQPLLIQTHPPEHDTGNGYPMGSMLASRHDLYRGRRVTLKRSRHATPYARTENLRIEAQVSDRNISTCGVSSTNLTELNALIHPSSNGANSQALFIPSFRPEQPQFWTSEPFRYEDAAFDNASVPTVDRSVTHNPSLGASSFHVTIGPTTNNYASWISTTEQPSTPNWKPNPVEPASMDHNHQPSSSAGYSANGFFVDPGYGVQVGPPQQYPAEEDMQMQHWFDFNSFGHQDAQDDSGGLQNVEVYASSAVGQAMMHSDWNAYTFTEH